MRYLLILLAVLALVAACSNPTEIVRHEPEIHAISLERTIVFVAETVGVSASVSDADKQDTITFHWSADAGSFVSETNNPTQWRAPNSAGEYSLTLVITDGYYEAAKSAEITVKNR